MLSVSPKRAAHAQLDDSAELAAHGYPQELARRMSQFENHAISLTVICVLAGCMSLFNFGLGAGGPAVMMWSWVAIGAMVLLLGLSLADVTSAYPTSGGMYFMADRLGGPRWGWFTGWLNLMGLLGAIAGIDYGCATFTMAFASFQWGVEPTAGATMTVFAVILLMHGCLNALGIRVVNILNCVSVWWQLGGVTVIVGALYLAPAPHQSAEWVFTQFNNDTGISSPLIVCLVGSLLAGYTFCGYDASSHLSEETKQAGYAAPKGMVRAIYVSWIAGFVLLAGLLFSIQDYTGTQNTSTGVAPAQIFLDVLGATGAKLLLLVVIVAMFFCGNAETAATSRMVYAFSRSGALPFSATWQRVNTRTRTPVPAVWLAVGAAFLLALPALWSPAAYAAVTAINAVGMTPAYAIPVFLSLRKGSDYRPGPWTLGKGRRPIGWIAVIYAVFITCVFILPQTSPVTFATMNYAGITLLVVLALAQLMWITRGRRTYHVPTLGSASQQADLSSRVI
ncbi:amino acid permease [Streptomyces turgidiscabies]|uniref:amino acid permease n=1 Tax=Streptomyces turgidiscabies TaxID=85558 RepID=UPI0038F628BA